MDAQELASDGMNIILLGKFDPLQITPPWLRQLDLIGAEDYDSYNVEIISKGGTIVSFGSIKLQIAPDSMQVATDASAEVEVARDLVVGILRSKGSSEISALGINRIVHFGTGLERQHAIGDRLAPKDPWDDVLHLPGMSNLGITGFRNDGYGGSINVSVQPSAIVRPGVFVSINDHYNLTYAEAQTDRSATPDPEQPNPQRSADKIPVAVEILAENFSASRNRALAIIDRVASFGTTSGGIK